MLKIFCGYENPLYLCIIKQQQQNQIKMADIKTLLASETIKARFTEVLKTDAPSFMANLAVMIHNSDTLSKCDPITVISCAVVSASLKLPLDPNLGYAYIVPYGSKAQFQIGYKGLIQLAIRSGQYATIGVTEIYEGQLLYYNPLTSDCEFDFETQTSDKVIGYAAHFRLLSGFEKTVYWSVAKVKAHGLKFSQTFKKGFGLWVDNFESMAKKTVLKHTLSKWGYLSIEMQAATKYDQAIVKNLEGDHEYADNKVEINLDNPQAKIISNE